jgi:N-acetylglucosaminyl-diphospho-decaprenol L-rhamnosyltransferase
MADPRVTVVVLTYARAAEVTRTVGHLYDAEPRPAIIVVDNGSPRSIGRELSAGFPGITVIQLASNIGAAARNIGVRHATTPYVALCDDDTCWSGESLGRAADVLDDAPRLAVVTGRVLVGTAQREDPTCRQMAGSPLPAVPGFPWRPILGFLAGASMIRRAPFLAVGGFEPRLFLGGEETLVALDLAAAGWLLAYVPTVVVHHHPSSLRDGAQRRRLLVRNGIWCAWLRRSGRDALRTTLRTAQSALRQREVRLGLSDAFRGLPWVLRHRRVVPGDLEEAVRLVERHAAV